MGTHTISIPDDSAAAYLPLNGDFVSATNRIADKVLCPLGLSQELVLNHYCEAIRCGIDVLLLPKRLVLPKLLAKCQQYVLRDRTQSSSSTEIRKSKPALPLKILTSNLRLSFCTIRFVEETAIRSGVRQLATYPFGPENCRVKNVAKFLYRAQPLVVVVGFVGESMGTWGVHGDTRNRRELSSIRIHKII